MIRSGDTIENPITGERLVFTATSAETAAVALDTASVNGLPAEAVSQIYQHFSFDGAGGLPNDDPLEGLGDADGDGVANFLEFDNDADGFTDAQELSFATGVNLVTPNELRGTGMAFYGAIGGILGAGSGPLLMAAASQYIYGSESAIGLGMATVIGVCGPLGAIFLALGFRAMREAVTEAESWER